MTRHTSLFGRALLVLLGMVVSVALHVGGLVVGMVTVVILGLGPSEGPWPERTQVGFTMSFGLGEWLYLVPTVLLLRRRQALAVSWGIIVTGLLGVAFSALALFGLLWRTFVDVAPVVRARMHLFVEDRRRASAEFASPGRRPRARRCAMCVLRATVVVVALASCVGFSEAQTITGPAGQISTPASPRGKAFTPPVLPPNKVMIDDMVFDRDRLSGMPVNGPRGAFVLPTYEWRLWEFGVIPVTFASNVTQAQRTKFFDDCAMWAPAGVVCLGRLAEPVWVRVQANDNGCWAEVGMGVSGSQTINLAADCWEGGTPAHEVAHAFGMMHEHQRTDRDSYVTVQFSNVEPAQFHNFDKYILGLNLSVYDFDSLMHYDRYAFNKSPGLVTLTPKAGYEQAAAKMGAATEPTASDLIAMAVMYRLPPLVYRTYAPVPSQFTIGRTEALAVMASIDGYYMAPGGLDRDNGLSINGRPDFLGLAAWFFDIYVNSRYAGYAEVEARYNVMANITQTDEWRTKHKGQDTAVPFAVANRLPFDRSELLAVMLRLDSFYRAPEGLRRPEGLSLNGSPDFQGIATWIVDVYMGARLSGIQPEAAWRRVVLQIQQTDEWRSKH